MAVETKIQERDERDPIVQGSLSWPLTVVALLLVLSTAWAMYDELVARRPWKEYQATFVPAHKKYLQDTLRLQREKEEEIEAREEYRDLEAEYVSLRDSLKPKREDLNERLALVTQKMEALTKVMKDARSYTASVLYRIETASSPREEETLRNHLATYHEGPFDVELSGGGGPSSFSYDYEKLLRAFEELKDQKSEIRGQLGDLVQAEAARKKAMDTYMARHLDGPTSAKVGDMLGGLGTFRYDLTSHQIHIKEVGLVDRCEVCHLAIRSPVTVTAEQIRKADEEGIPEEMARAFTSHPLRRLPGGDLLDVHSPDKFGCTSCHGGNGRALTAVDEAHGRYKHWLWPLYEKDNTEAGCHQCHQGALHLEGAPTLNRGRELYLRLGCWACHPREGYDAEAVALKETNQEQKRIAEDRRRLRRELDAFYESDEDLEGDPGAIKQELSQLDVDSQQLTLRRTGLRRARKRPGPNLKDVRAKLKKEWLPVWLEDPRAFRPTTRMPDFRLTSEQARAIAAFLWQNAPEKKVPEHPPGDPVRGEQTFEARGCQACHRLGDEVRRETFAADLSRMGDKVNYNYLVEWIRNPPEHTLMPNLRLADAEARDVAAYLLQQKTGAAYEPAEYLDDEGLFHRGRDLVKHYACFSCHEIAGMEERATTATDLTQEGSKPIERLDFARFTHDAQRQGWYTNKGFFDRKLADPRLFDEGRVKLDWRENLRMPDYGLSERPEDREALVTFLLGSVDSRLPSFFYHYPTGWAKDIEDGWWVVKKHNCTSCHQMTPEHRPAVWDLPQYQGEDREKAPPSLVGAGARLDAEWLATFLRDPALGESRPHRNGVRIYLDIRMPTFSLSEEEIGKLVRFFEALSKQPSPYPHEKLAPLDQDELADARLIFQKSKCLSCHVTSDDPKTFTSETKAPNYQVSAERLKPHWNRMWLRDPDQIMPGTVMPPLFEETAGRWKAVTLPANEARAKGADHVELLVRYMKFFDETEANVQERLQEEEK